MSVPTRRSQNGFTIIELLVVIVIIALLIALLLPAVQQARVAARRAQCKSRIRQLGIALHNYHDTYRVFPSGLIGINKAGWGTMILPFVEQSPIYNQFDWSQNVADDDVAHYTLSAYWCPSETRPGTNSDFGNGVSTYLGNYGSGSVSQFDGSGIFWLNNSMKIRNIIDGTSNTFLLGETIGSGHVWVGEELAKCLGDAATAPNVGTFASRHPGGVHFCLADTSIRFVSVNIDSQPTGINSTQGIYQNLADRNDKQVVPEF